MRHGLFHPGSPASKYLLYATGEILLVVLGILFALQVNNWNEKRKFNSTLTEIFVQIRDELVLDTIMLKEDIEYREIDLQAQERIIDQLSDKRAFDSLSYYDLGRVNLKRPITLLNEGYELLQELGMASITDKILRTALLSYYKTNQTTIYQEIEDDAEEFYNYWIPFVRQNFKAWKFGIIGIPVNDSKLTDDQSFLMGLIMNKGNLESTLNAEILALDQARNLIHILNNKLN